MRHCCLPPAVSGQQRIPWVEHFKTPKDVLQERKKKVSIFLLDYLYISSENMICQMH